MRNIIAATVALVTVLTAQAASGQFLVPGADNPVPSISFNVTSVPVGVTNIYCYQGTNTGQYTSKKLVGNVASFTVTNVVRGTRYFFALTSVANGLESTSFSNEVNATVPVPPGPPTITLIVQTKTGLDDGSQWANTGDRFTVPATGPTQVFRMVVARQDLQGGVATHSDVNIMPAARLIHVPPVPGL